MESDEVVVALSSEDEGGLREEVAEGEGEVEGAEGGSGGEGDLRAQVAEVKGEVAGAEKGTAAMQAHSLELMGAEEEGEEEVEMEEVEMEMEEGSAAGGLCVCGGVRVWCVFS